MQTQTKDINADYITYLPINDIEPSDFDQQIINSLFVSKQEKSTTYTYIVESLLIILLFVLISFPTIDTYINNNLLNVYPFNSIIKAILFLILFWIIKYLIT